jgi:hypothetical protein
MRDPPETTTVKAPLWAANFAESSAAYLASDTARSSSASKMSRFFLDAAAGAAPSVAMAAAVGRSVRAEERRRGRGRRVLNGTRDAGGERRRGRGRVEGDAAAEAESDMEVDMCYM